MYKHVAIPKFATNSLGKIIFEWIYLLNRLRKTNRHNHKKDYGNYRDEGIG